MRGLLGLLAILAAIALGLWYIEHRRSRAIATPSGSPQARIAGETEDVPGVPFPTFAPPPAGASRSEALPTVTAEAGAHSEPAVSRGNVVGQARYRTGDLPPEGSIAVLTRPEAMAPEALLYGVLDALDDRTHEGLGERVFAAEVDPSTGRFELQGVPDAGSYRLVVLGPGVLSSPEVTLVRVGAPPTTIDIAELHWASFVLLTPEGVAKDPADGLPLDTMALDLKSNNAASSPSSRNHGAQLYRPDSDWIGLAVLLGFIFPFEKEMAGLRIFGSWVPRAGDYFFDGHVRWPGCPAALQRFHLLPANAGPPLTTVLTPERCGPTGKVAVRLAFEGLDRTESASLLAQLCVMPNPLGSLELIAGDRRLLYPLTLRDSDTLRLTEVPEGDYRAQVRTQSLGLAALEIGSVLRVEAQGLTSLEVRFELGFGLVEFHSSGQGLGSFLLVRREHVHLQESGEAHLVSPIVMSEPPQGLVPLAPGDYLVRPRSSTTFEPLKWPSFTVLSGTTTTVEID